MPVRTFEQHIVINLEQYCDSNVRLSPTALALPTKLFVTTENA